MHHAPKHILVGESAALDLFHEDQNQLVAQQAWDWIVPKSSKQGDTVLLLIGKKFVGEAVIRADPMPSGLPGEYVSTFGALKLWGIGVLVEQIAKQLPDWKYLTYTRSYLSVPPEHQQPLLEAINRALEDEDEEDISVALAPHSLGRQEVISVPAAHTIHITQATGVHAFPNEFPWSGYRPTPYMTFRPSGGAMKRLYRIEWQGVLPRLLGDLERVPHEYRERVRTYIERRERDWHFTDDNFKFTVLSLENTIELLHQPHLKNNIQGHCYFWLADLLSGERVIEVSSKSKGLLDPVKVKPLAQALAEVEAPLPGADEESMSSSSDEFDPDAFDPATLNYARDYQAKQVAARRGQPSFRQKLLDAYQEQCAFTGYAPKEALEAAHIVPFCGPDSDQVVNGLLLRADIHSLFDQGLIVVDITNPQQPTLVLAPHLLVTTYKYLQGKAVRLPDNVALRPSVRALEWHRHQAGL